MSDGFKMEIAEKYTVKNKHSTDVLSIKMQRDRNQKERKKKEKKKRRRERTNKDAKRRKRIVAGIKM